MRERGTLPTKVKRQSALIVEYEEFHWLVIQIVEKRCHISGHIKYLFKKVNIS